MYSDFYPTTFVNTSSVDSTWIVISAVIAIFGGLFAYFMFVANKESDKYTGFVAWLHGFLNFKKLFIAGILKVMYIISAIFITLSSFSFISVSIASFFLYLILGNVIARISYELLLMIITIVNNTTEINRKLPELKKEVVKSKKNVSEEE